MGWGQSLSGQLVMVGGVMTAATVMVTLLVRTPSLLALSVRGMTNRGIWRDAPPHSPQPTAVETNLRNKL